MVNSNASGFAGLANLKNVENERTDVDKLEYHIACSSETKSEIDFKVVRNAF